MVQCPASGALKNNRRPPRGSTHLARRSWRNRLLSAVGRTPWRCRCCGARCRGCHCMRRTAPAPGIRVGGGAPSRTRGDEPNNTPVPIHRLLKRTESAAAALCAGVPVVTERPCLAPTPRAAAPCCALRRKGCPRSRRCRTGHCPAARLRPAWVAGARHSGRQSGTAQRPCARSSPRRRWRSRRRTARRCWCRRSAPRSRRRPAPWCQLQRRQWPALESSVAVCRSRAPSRRGPWRPACYPVPPRTRPRSGWPACRRCCWSSGLGGGREFMRPRAHRGYRTNLAHLLQLLQYTGRGRGSVIKDHPWCQ